jgi:hypothetical protein
MVAGKVDLKKSGVGRGIVAMSQSVDASPLGRSNVVANLHVVDALDFASTYAV